MVAGALAWALLGCSVPRTTKQQSLNEWRSLTSASAAPPRVFVKSDQVRFYFPGTNGVEAFVAHWSRARVPVHGYKVKTAVLRWDQRLSRIPKHDRGWREAQVVAGAEWRNVATNLIEHLTPQTPGHGAYYQEFLSDGLLYRDRQGQARFVPLAAQPQDVVVDHQYSVEETLEVVSGLAGEHLARIYPGRSLFLLMAPNARRFTQPLLIDRQQRRCVGLMPSALFDFTERGVTPSATLQGLSAMVPESHGWALLKNPVSSAFRALDLGIETVVRFVRLPLPKPGADKPPISHAPGMDLAQWEAWLDRYTGTHSERGSLDLLIDGERFFPRLRQAVAEATNHIWVNVYIFDRDDVACGIADQLKERSTDLDVRVVLDRMGSIAAGQAPPSTPLPEHFEQPRSIVSYLREDSKVKVRTFLNPWFTSDHSKVFIVDGNRAWLGGMNFGREYEYEWHDMMVEVTGPVVASLETEFKHVWAHAGPAGDLAYVAALLQSPVPVAPEAATDPAWIGVRRLPTKTGWKPFNAAVRGALSRAQNRIYVENPYLFDKRVILALVRARNRGVDVRVVLPRVNDFKAGGRGNLVVANYLLEHGVRVFFYPGMTHVKALLVDGWACVGSGNLNHLSLRVNQEQNVATSDPAFLAHLEHQLFESDFRRAYELTEPITVDWVDLLTDLLLEGF